MRRWLALGALLYCGPAAAAEMCPTGQIAVCVAPIAAAIPVPPDPPKPPDPPPVIDPPPKPPAGVLFQEGFERDLSAWGETAQQARLACGGGVAHSGLCALEVDQPAFGWGGELVREIGPREQVYLSFWWKFPDAIPPHTAGGHFFRLGAASRKEPQFDTQIDGGRMTLVSDWGIEIPLWGAVALPVGRWFRFELFYKLNTPGKADGVVQAWVDGVKVYEAVGEKTKFRDVANGSIRFLRFVTNYDNCPTKTGCRWFYDDLEVRAARP
jgi:hypothetical protein